MSVRFVVDMNYVISRLGFVIDFLSKATLLGFMAGAAVIVSLQQLKGLLGIVHFTSKMQLVPVLSSVFHQRNEVDSTWESWKKYLKVTFKHSQTCLSKTDHWFTCWAVVLANHCYGSLFSALLIDNKENRTSCSSCLEKYPYRSYRSMTLKIFIMTAEHEKTKTILDFSSFPISISYLINNSSRLT